MPRIAREITRFTKQEIALIVNAVYHHSDKQLISKDPYVELVKDADLLAWVLYEDAHDAIVRKYANPTPIFARIKRIRKELNLPKDPQWDI